MASVLPPRLIELIKQQDGVLRRDQVEATGLSRGRLRALLDGGRWQDLGPTLLVNHNGPLSIEQQRWAAVLAAGSEGCLGGRTALTLAGLTGWDDGLLHVLAPHGHRWPVLGQVPMERHTTRRFEEDDGDPVARPRRTGVERSAIDAATWSRSPRTACGVLAAVVQQRLTTAERLTARLATTGRIRHRRLLMAVLVDIGGGAQALSEVDFGLLCRRHGLPEPLRQQVRVDGQGRRRYLDAELVGTDGTRVCVEVDGAAHMAVDQWIRDAHRGNELLIAGDRVLRFPSTELRLHPEAVADQIRRALGLTAP